VGEGKEGRLLFSNFVQFLFYGRQFSNISARAFSAGDTTVHFFSARRAQKKVVFVGVTSLNSDLERQIKSNVYGSILENLNFLRSRLRHTRSIPRIFGREAAQKRPFLSS